MLRIRRNVSAVVMLALCAGLRPDAGRDAAGSQGDPGSVVPGWTPDLVKIERRLTMAMLIRM